ncbi:cell adhesion molecule Dscam2-like [Penaeus indicus]|uniref:cell adhesion molecule Dscam2-like n=1 Tax=Penaeus indicus TaxID=29960 RepID=UPI00300C5844
MYAPKKPVGEVTFNKNEIIRVWKTYTGIYTAQMNNHGLKHTRSAIKTILPKPEKGIRDNVEPSYTDAHCSSNIVSIILGACAGLSLHQPDASAGPLSELKVHRVRGTNPARLLVAGRVSSAPGRQVGISDHGCDVGVFVDHGINGYRNGDDTPELLEIACVSSLELRLPGTSNVYEIESKIRANGDREKATWGKHGHLGVCWRELFTGIKETSRFTIQGAQPRNNRSQAATEEGQVSPRVLRLRHLQVVRDPAAPGVSQTTFELSAGKGSRLRITKSPELYGFSPPLVALVMASNTYFFNIQNAVWVFMAMFAAGVELPLRARRCSVNGAVRIGFYYLSHIRFYSYRRSAALGVFDPMIAGGLVVGQYVGVGGSVVSHVNITGVRTEDGGAYACTAVNRAGSTAHQARLNVYGKAMQRPPGRMQQGSLLTNSDSSAGPAYVRPMSVVTAVAGEQLAVSCPAAGYPLAQLTWSRDGRTLPVTARQKVYENGTLVITRVEKSRDGGSYTCTAQDKHGRTHSATATVQVLGRVGRHPECHVIAVPPKLSIFTFRRDLALGERVYEACTVIGGDKPVQVTWTKDGVPVKSIEGVQVRNLDQLTTFLVIDHLSPRHAGNYTCTATNDAASAQHTSALNVNASARRARASECRRSAPCGGATRLSLSRGSKMASLSVRTRRLASPYAHWTSFPVFFSSLTPKLTTVATTLARPQAPPALPPIQPPSSSTLRQSLGYTPTPTIIRLDDHIYNHQVTRLHPRSLDTPIRTKSDLLITQTRKEATAAEDASAPKGTGRADWWASRERAWVEGESAMHLHYVPPSWIEAPRDTSVTLGGSVVIPCHAHGFPAPVVTWRRTRAEDQPGQYSQILGGGHGLGVSVASNGSLVVVGARSEDEAQYLCEAVNEVGGGLSALISLTVNVPPRFDPGLQRQVSVRRGARATLLCHAQGDPPITLLWQAAHTRVHDLSVVREVDGGVRGELTIPAAKMEDAGDYTCTASNSYGRDSFVVTLVVQVKIHNIQGLTSGKWSQRRRTCRGRPTDCGCLREDPDTWSCPGCLPPPPTRQLTPTLCNTGLQEVMQEITSSVNKPAGTWSDGQEETVRGETTTARLTPLVPDTQYLVRVLAANHLGASPHSEPLQVRTEGEAPSAPPTSVRSDAVSPTSLRVVWEPPPAHTHHGDLLGYHVGVRRHDLGNDESYNFSVVGVGAGGGGREVVTALRAWVQYAVAVRAYNAHGAGPVSPPVVVRTLEDVPSSPPVGVECSGGAGGTSLYVRWAPPPPTFHNGLLQGYRLTLTRLDDSTGKMQRLLPRPCHPKVPCSLCHEPEKVEELIRMTSGREESVGGLRAWSNYTVTVAAVTRAGAGVSSPDLICTTREDVAGVPGGLRALQSDVGAAILTWLPPHPPTGVLLGYTLNHRPPHARAPSQHPLHAHANSHSLTHLSRGTHEFWLTARTRAGEGKPTPTLKLTILDQVPAGVASLGKEVVATLGDDVRFVCVTVGAPPPMPAWSVDGRHLEKDGRSSLTSLCRLRFTQEADGSLVIRGVERGDLGNYTCSIHSVRKSPYVHTSTTYVLHVQVPPTAPSVHIADATSSTLTVSWAAGDTGGAPVRAWAVWWRAAVGGGVWHTRELGRTHSRHVINELQCGTEYQVYVTARTHVGVSPPSRPLTARTSGSPPVAPPTRHVASGNSTGVWAWLGRWADGGCPITHFTLELRRPRDPSWTTLASSLAPQDVYEVGGLQAGAIYGLRLTAHNAAGATTSTVDISTGPGGGLGAQPAGELELAPPNPIHTDPRLMASAAASALALALTVAAAVLCFRRRVAAGRSGRGAPEDQEAEQNKTNLLQQRDTYYATVRKPQPVPATLERIPGTTEKETGSVPARRAYLAVSGVPEYSEDIYPYATFQLGEGRGGGQDETVTNKFQTFVFQDSRYGVTEGHPPTSPSRPTPKKSHGRSGSRGRGAGGPRSESEEYDSLQSDTDTEHATSSRTESSIHLDSATLESHHTALHLPLDPHLATLEPRPDAHAAHAARRPAARTVHHSECPSPAVPSAP